MCVLDSLPSHDLIVHGCLNRIVCLVPLSGREKVLDIKCMVLIQRRDSNEDERDGAVKKPRVVWSVEMHQQFVNAVNQLGVDSKLSYP